MPPKPLRWSIADQLREIINNRGLTAYALGKAAGVDAGVIQRFLGHERDIRLETAGRLAAVLGVRLAEVSTRRARPRPELPETPAVLEHDQAENETGEGENHDYKSAEIVSQGGGSEVDLATPS